MTNKLSPNAGISTIVNHYTEGDNALGAHVSPIYQTTTFGFPDVATMQRIFEGEQAGYVYSRGNNPNVEQLGRKYAYLEGLDLIRDNPTTAPDEIVAGRAVSSGMAAISAAALARVGAGDTVIAQRVLYGTAFNFWHILAPRLGIKVVWVDGEDNKAWEAALTANPQAKLLYTETPANPTMSVVDLSTLAEIAHSYQAWVMVDNTFATPYHQRPLSRSCDIVIHSTTKYLSGHGQITGGAIVSHHLDYMNDEANMFTKTLGQTPSPFDCWLANIGLKTFEVRMERHAANGQAMAEYLAHHPKVSNVNYPGLPNDSGHGIASQQMINGYGAMIAFELTGGYEAGVKLMESIKLATFAVSLGNVDSLIEHPASMTHKTVPAEEKEIAGITDGLVRLSVGIENIEDLLADMAQALGN